MTRRQPPRVRYGSPSGGRNAAEKRAEAWIRENSFSGRGRRVRDDAPTQTSEEHTAPKASFTAGINPHSRTFLNLQRQSFPVEYFHDEPFRDLLPHLNKRPRMKIIADNLGREAVRRFGFENAKERLEKVKTLARATISFGADRVVTHTTGDFTYIGFMPEAGTRSLIEEDLALAQDALELPRRPEVRSLLVAKFRQDDPHIEDAVKLLDGFISVDSAAEHALLGSPVVRSNP